MLHQRCPVTRRAYQPPGHQRGEFRSCFPSTGAKQVTEGLRRRASVTSPKSPSRGELCFQIPTSDLGSQDLHLGPAPQLFEWHLGRFLFHKNPHCELKDIKMQPHTNVLHRHMSHLIHSRGFIFFLALLLDIVRTINRKKDSRPVMDPLHTTSDTPTSIKTT